MKRMFLSYASADRELADALVQHLAPLKRSGRIELFVDHSLEVGSPWPPALAAELERADVLLCLLSPLFFASDWCAHELAAAERRRIPIVPVFGRSVNWQSHPVVGRYQGLPAGGRFVAESPDRDPVLAEVAAGLARLLEVPSPITAPPVAPPVAPVPASALRPARPVEGRLPRPRKGSSSRAGPGTFLLARATLTGDSVQWTFMVPHGGHPLAEHTTTLAQLDRTLLVSRRELAEAAADPNAPFLAGADPLRLGDALRRWLFGPAEDALFETLMRVPHARPVARPVRLRLQVPPALAALPWRLLAQDEWFLEEAGWVVELGPPPTPPATLTNPCPVLAILPECRDGHAQLHARLLHHLRTEWGAKADAYLHVVRSRSDLDAFARTHRAPVVFLGADGDGRGGLYVDTDGGGTARVPLAGLLPASLDARVVVTVAAGLSLDQLGVPAAGGPSVEGAPDDLADVALAWLTGVLREGADPSVVAAGLEVDHPEARLWRVVNRPERWTVAATGAVDRAAGVWKVVDRSRQRGQLVFQVNTFRRTRRKSLRVLGPADGDHHTPEALGAILWEHARIELADVAHRRYELPLDAHANVVDLERDVGGILGAGAGPTARLGDRLTAAAQAARGKVPGEVVLWLDWGVAPAPLPRPTLENWLQFTGGPLARACPDRVRVVSLLTLRVGEDGTRALRTLAAGGNTEIAAAVVLDPLDNLTVDELDDFLLTPACSFTIHHSARDARPLAEHLFQLTGGGRFDEVVRVLEHAEQHGWDELLAAARTLPGPGPAPLPDTFG